MPLAETTEGREAHRQELGRLLADLHRDPSPVKEASVRSFAEGVGLGEAFKRSPHHLRVIAEADRIKREESARARKALTKAEREFAKTQAASRALIEKARTAEREAGVALASAKRAATEADKADAILHVVEDGRDPAEFPEHKLHGTLGNKVLSMAWAHVKGDK